MRSPKTRSNPEGGSTLLAVMMVVILLALAAGSALQYSAAGYRASARQAALEQAKMTGESDMEYLFYKWKDLAINHTAPAAIPDALHTAGVTVDPGSELQPSGSPFLPSQGGVVARRSLVFLPPTAIGNIPGTNQISTISTFKALEFVDATSPGVGSTQFRFGRRFTYSQTSLFQYSVFYQGNMEFSAGSNLTIRGNTSCNSSIYIGAQAGVTLTVVNNMQYGALFNGAADPLTGTQHKIAGDNLIDPIFDSDPTDGVTPPQAAARAAQVAPLSSALNFVGGVNVATARASYPDAYSNTNDVYRAIIAPPPVDAGNNLIPEDPIIASRRMYNQAGLRIKIGGATPTTVSIISPSDPLTDYHSDSHFAGVITNVRKQVFDKREGRNIYITEIDIGALKTALDAFANLQSAYTGVIYLLDVNNGYTDGAFRLVNGTSTPNYQSKGFTVATNNGLYVKGDYNTEVISGPDTVNSAALMADAITLLSPGWNDANSAQPLSSRVATVDAADTPGSIAKAHTVTIAAAMISGNTPSPATTSTGGVQNLVRYLEDWWSADAASTTFFRGSLGQLFTSVFFTGPYKNSGATNGVYSQPHNRNLAFDSNLAANPPGGTPTVTAFSRGDYFIW